MFLYIYHIERIFQRNRFFYNINCVFYHLFKIKFIIIYFFQPAIYLVSTSIHK